MDLLFLPSEPQIVALSEGLQNICSTNKKFSYISLDQGTKEDDYGNKIIGYTVIITYHTSQKLLA